jgi:hypothetical protein
MFCTFTLALSIIIIIIIIIVVVVVVVGCGGCPNHRHLYLKRVSAATTSDNTMTYIYIYIIYNIFYSTTWKYINPDTCIVQWKKLVHQWVVCKLLPKNYHEESLITSRCHIYNSFYYPTDQFGIRNYKSNQMSPNITLSFRTLKFGTKQLNHAYLAW